ncbi:MAG: LytR/AlgR family response regulator transcription factor, partial [bacterium]
PERLAETIEKIQKRRRPAASEMASFYEKIEAGEPRRRMAVKCGSKYRVFDPAKISAVLARDHYAVMLVEGQELLADDSLETLSKRLDPRKFLRVHRGALLNLDYLKELEHEGDRKYLAVLSDSAQTRLPVSRERLDELKKRLGLDGR